WDPIIAKDKGGHLQKIMDEVVDGEMQNFKAKGGAYTRENFFGKHPEALKLVKGLSDEEIYKLNRGGHDPYKVYAAYHEAVNHKGAPTVILALTTKGYGVGSREADNTTHQVKKLSLDNIKIFRDRFDIPVSDDEIEDLPYVRPKEDSPEIKYLKETREKLGGPVPKRRENSETLKLKNKDAFKVLHEGSGERKVSTTTNCVRIMNNLIKDENLGERVVPIVPDEARTFGMEGMFKQIGIYSSEGQLYEPEDADQVMWYKESETGVMLEEGITEAGSFAAWTALATSYSNHNLTMIPFYVFYSMFGFQRIHDLAWAAGDAQAKGFLIGATSGRTTLNGEGLQHQDGHSHILSSTIPNCKSYDPAYGYELAVIIEHGLKEMYKDKKNYFYYLTVTNERYPQPPKPKGKDVDSNIIKGMHRISKTKKPQIRLLGSGAILNESIKAAEILSGYGIESEVWSVTSFNMLRKDGMEVENESIKNASNKAKESFVAESFSEHDIPTVASTDYMRAYSEQIRPYINSSYYTLGTDGFGRSDSRAKLREFFEVDAKSIVMTSAYALHKEDKLNKTELQKIYKEIKVNKDKIAPWNT
ncbi:MAG: transketolase-like TK C-terminal-containing protein, partial [Gammaproteobacteria bacterium]